VAVIDPRPVRLSFSAEHVAAAPHHLPLYLKHVIAHFRDDWQDAPSDQFDGNSHDQLERISLLLKQCIRPAIVCGTGNGDAVLVNLAADVAGALRNIGKLCGLFYLIEGANGFAAAAHAGNPAALDNILSSIEEGATRALVLFESNPHLRYPDQQRLVDCLERLELLVVMDCLNTPASRAAHVFLPTTTIYESGGKFVNQECRIQQAMPINGGGIPVLQEGRVDHPPRVFRTDAPGIDPVPAWQLLTAMASAGVIPERVPWPDDGLPILSEMAREEHIPTGGIRILPFPSPPEQILSTPADERPDTDTDPGGMTLITVERTFGTEELSCRSAPLQEIEDSPAATMHSIDAVEMGLDDGDVIVIDNGTGEIRVRLSVSDRMARGVVILPRHHRLEWQCLPNFHVSLPPERIRRAEGGGS